jgi:hypothetical protein
MNKIYVLLVIILQWNVLLASIDLPTDTSLVLWLKADAIAQDSGSHVGLWPDLSRYNNHAFSKEESHHNAPEFITNRVNGLPVLKFNHEYAQQLYVNNNPSINCDELTLFVVGCVSKDNKDWSGFLVKSEHSEWESGYGIATNDDKGEYIGFSSDYTEHAVTSPYVYDDIQLITLSIDAKSLELYNDGMSQGKTEHIGKIENNNNNLWIGWTSDYFSGEIAEIVMYNRALSENSIQSIHKYLLHKYGLDSNNRSNITETSFNFNNPNYPDYINDFNINYENSSMYASWSSVNSTDGSEYLVQRSDSDGNFKTINTVSANDTNYIIEIEMTDVFYSLYRLIVVTNSKDSVILNARGVDHVFLKEQYLEVKKLEEKHDLEEKVEQQSDRTKRISIIATILIIAILLGSVLYYHKKTKIRLLEREELLTQINTLKEKAIVKTVSNTGAKKELVLDKAKIEKVTDYKFAESAWNILQIIYSDPTVSNKELAEKVFLSLEGVSSSLRKMYSVFNITSKSNKKVALIMEAAKISADE